MRLSWERSVRMFSVGQLVLYGTNGVCTVEDITEKTVGSFQAEYYVLKPTSAAASTLFVPTANEQLVGKMRPVMTAEEINGVLSQKSDGGEWIESKNERTEAFKDIIASGDPAALLGMIRLLHAHRDLQTGQGKRLHLSDERFLKEAEKMIGEEFSLVLGVDRDEAIALILA